MRAVAYALLGMLVASCAGTTGVVDDGLCRATAADVQEARDYLEIARTQLKASKDNFGPGRAKAIAAVAAAVESLQQAAGRPLEPAPETLVHPRMAGGHNHPHMHWAIWALYKARQALEGARCVIPGGTAGVFESIAAAKDAIDEAFAYNPPGSGH